jgi:hypothetical protein
LVPSYGCAVITGSTVRNWVTTDIPTTVQNLAPPLPNRHSTKARKDPAQPTAQEWFFPTKPLVKATLVGQLKAYYREVDGSLLCIY